MTKKEPGKRMAKKERGRERKNSSPDNALATRVNDRTERSVGRPEWEDRESRRRGREKKERESGREREKREAKGSFCPPSVLLLIHSSGKLTERYTHR